MADPQQGWTLVEPAAPPTGWTLVQPAAARKPAATEDYLPPQKSFLDSAINFASNFAHTVDPRPALEALYDLHNGALSGDAEAVDRTLARAKGIGQASADQFKKGMQAFREGRISEAVGHTLAAVPLVGPPIGQAGEQIASGDYSGGAGTTAGLLAPFGAKYATEVARTGSLIPTAEKVAAAPPIGVPESVTKAGQAVASAAKKAGPVAVTVAEHLPFVGRPIRAINAGVKILNRVIEMADKDKPAPNTGGRLVKGVGPSVDSVIADALDDLLKPDAAPGVELPPPAELPPGYTPRTSAPEPAPAAQPHTGGRLVAPTKRLTVEQQLANALADLQKPEPPARVTTPPQPDLPPGYAPRTSIGPKNYFLKSTDAPAAPSAAAAPSPALPQSWQGLTGEPTFPPTEIEGSRLAAAFQQELSKRGVKAADAIKLVQANANLPPAVRLQLITALKKAGGIK